MRGYTLDLRPVVVSGWWLLLKPPLMTASQWGFNLGAKATNLVAQGLSLIPVTIPELRCWRQRGFVVPHLGGEPAPRAIYHSAPKGCVHAF